MRLTLRTLLAYLDDTLEPAQTREIGRKVAASPEAQALIERVRRVTRKRSLATPPPGSPIADINTVTAYLGDALPSEATAEFEKQCLESDVHLAEVAAVHQILTLLLCEQARVPPRAYRRMYELVDGPESVPNRRPGNTIPVGGAREIQPTNDDSDDAAYLLGLSAYTRTEAPGQYAMKLVAGVVLALIAVGAAAFAWPRGTTRTPTELAALAPAPTDGAAAPATTPPPSVPAAETPEPGTPPAVQIPEVPVDPAQPTDPPAEPQSDPDAPAPREAETPAPEAAPANKPRQAIGQIDGRRPTTVLVRQAAADGPFVRVTATDPTIFSGERLMALPGYKVPVRFGGVAVELWGNLPELLPTPLPLLESAVTPAVPDNGITADFQVHTGRVYIRAVRPEGAVVRVRVADYAWDVKFADEKSEIVVEVVNALTPSGQEPPTRSAGGLFVLSGTVEVTAVSPQAGPPAPLATGAAAYFDSQSGSTDVRPPDADAGTAAYWSRFVTPADADRAATTLKILSDFATKLTDPTRVKQTFDAGLPTGNDGTPDAAARARVALFTLAALGDVPTLVNALSDTEKPLLRSTAAEGLRAATATNPTQLATIEKSLSESGVPAEESAQAVRLLRGLSDAERTDPAAAANVVKLLSSNTLQVRELAFGLLVGAVDPADPAAPTLFNFDPGAPPADRAPYAEAWAKWAANLSKTPPADEKKP